MELSDFQQNGKGISNLLSIEDRDLKILVRREDGEELFKISCYGYQIPISYITGRKTLEEVDEVVKDICKKLEWVYSITEDVDLKKFIKQLHIDYPKKPKNTRLHLESADGKITMFVEVHQGYFVPKVRDFEKGTNIVKEAHLHPRVATEEECERIIYERMNEYDCFGYYSRTLKKAPRYRTEHEKTSKDEHLSVTWSIENIPSKKEHEFLLKQQEIFRNMETN